MNNWLKDAIIYNILIDRFARGKGEPWLDSDYLKPVFCGGNLQGVIDKLDYLRNLGVNTILFSPFQSTSAYHGYHVTDFFTVDQHFGTIEIVKELLEKAHRKNIRIIMDLVINHVSSRHPYFMDARENPNSKYRDWFKFSKWPDEYMTFLVFPDLPKLNLDNIEVRKHIVDAALYWLQIGFDGFRLDHIIGVPNSFHRELRAAVKEKNPDAVLIGEAVKGLIRRREIKTLQIKNKYLMYILSQAGLNTSFFLQLQYVRYLDGVFDFFCRDMAKSFFVKKRWFKPLWLLNFILRVHFWSYPKNFSLISLLDNADHDRFIFLLKNNVEELQKVVRWQFSLNQPEMILYGNEAGLKQAQSRKIKVYGDKEHGDLAIRPIMPWGNIDQKMFDYYRKMISMKKAGR